MRIAYTASIWLVVALSFERYLAICKPLHHSQVFRRTRDTLIISACIIAAAFIVNVVAFFEYILVVDNKTNESTLIIQDTDERPAISMYYLVLRMTSHYITPLGFIICLNASIMRDIIKAKQFHERLSIRQRRQLNNGTMFLFYIFLFVACHALPIAHYLLENVCKNWYIYENQRRYFILKVYAKED